MMTSQVLRIDSGEDFPPLGVAININGGNSISSGKSTSDTSNSNCSNQQQSPEKDKFQSQTNSTSVVAKDIRKLRKRQIVTAGSDSESAKSSYDDITISVKSNDDDDSFVKCRIGSQLCDYGYDFKKIFREQHIGRPSHFVLVPIAPIRQALYEADAGCFEVLPDLVLNTDEWAQHVAIDLGHPNLCEFNPRQTMRFDELFQHALYLNTSAIVVTCPDSDLSQVQIASIVNDRIKNLERVPLILFRISMDSHQYCSRPQSWLFSQREPPSDQTNQIQKINDVTTEELTTNGKGLGGTDNEYPWDLSKQLPSDLSSSEDEEQSSESKAHHQEDASEKKSCPWSLWDSIRNHLLPCKRIGVCLWIRQDLSGSDEELSRWTGEPVRMIIINVDQFVRSPGLHSQGLRLTSKCHHFIERIMLANSLKTSLVLEAQADLDLSEHMQYLVDLIEDMRQANPDPLRSWQDKLQSPLQPLSSNLSSNTYSVFEADTKKYLMYRDAMIEALDRLVSMDLPEDIQQEDKTFVLMVLGAGRGPLVDCFIDAIRTLQNCPSKFKIYALDKNTSSIRALKYKQKFEWQSDDVHRFETEVIESDMRTWKPMGLKADIIATELLGSLADNELSPECIDGVWTISNSATISIPQEYTSYLAPISSFSLFQQMGQIKVIDRYVFDRIYVAKLSNFYQISEPQKLFTFEHKNLSIPPEQRCNARFKRLQFRSKVNIVCHGFAGYFSAHLFGTTHISTVPGQSTPKMDSWFPAFIPLEKPIPLAKGSSLEVLFWRKETSTSVWYEWAIVHPERSRIYSQSGRDTRMSKFID